MSLTLLKRLSKGSPLTYQELDNNLTLIESEVNSKASSSSPSFSGNIQLQNNYSLLSPQLYNGSLINLIKMTNVSNGEIEIGTNEGLGWGNLFLKSGNGGVYADVSSGNGRSFIVRGVSGAVGTEVFNVRFDGLTAIPTGSLAIGAADPGTRKCKITTSDSVKDVALDVSIGRTTGTNYAIYGSATGSGATSNFGGFFTASGATANYGVRIFQVAAGSNHYALYSDSLAQSYFQGGVGIGTSSPKNQLQIGATKGLDADNLVYNAYYSGGWKFLTNNAANILGTYLGDFRFYTSVTGTADAACTMTEKFTILVNGNVGIGYATPSVESVVARSTAVPVRHHIQNSTTGFAANNGLQLGIDGTGNGYLWSYYNGNLSFGTNNTNRLTIDNAGNLAIGTTTAQCKLDFGTTVANQKLFIGTWVSGNNWTGIGMDATTAGIRIAGDQASLCMDVGSYSVDAAHTWTSRMIVRGDTGNVCIGTGTEVSGYKLQINGNMLLGNKTATSTTSTTSISLGGSYSSTLLGNTNGTNLKIKTYDDGTYYTGFGNSSGQLDYVISGSGSHVWYSNNQQRMMIDTNGVFSVGASKPLLINGASLYSQRNGNARSGISWFADTYRTWCSYMSNAGTAGSGPSGLITAPNGTYVTTWGLRSLIENQPTYGWTWESCAEGSGAVTPVVMAELNSYTGNFKAAGKVEGSTFKSVVANGTAPIEVASTTMVTNLNSNYLNGVASSGFATSTHTHGLARHNIAAPSTIDTLTNANFRTTLFGTTVGSNLSVARWDNLPTLLPGMNLYGTMIAWGASDTHGFLAVNYSAGAQYKDVIVGGGSADGINWSREVATITDTTWDRGSINVITADSAIRLKTTGGTVDKNTWEMRSIGQTGYEYLQFRTVNDAQSVFTTRMALWNTGGLYIGSTPSDPGQGNLALTTLLGSGDITLSGTTNKISIGNDVTTVTANVSALTTKAFKSNCTVSESTTVAIHAHRFTTLVTGTVNSGFGVNGIYGLLETPVTNTNNHTGGIAAGNISQVYYGAGTANATLTGFTASCNYASTITNNTVGQSVTINGIAATAQVTSTGSIDYLRGAMVQTNITNTGGVSKELVGMYSAMALSSTADLPDVKCGYFAVTLTGSPTTLNYLYGTRTALDVRPATNVTIGNMFGQDVNVTIGAASVGTPTITTSMVGVNCNVVAQKSSTIRTMSGAWFYAGVNTTGVNAAINYCYAVNCKTDAKESNITNQYGIAITGAKDAAGVIGTWMGLYINSNPISATMGAGTTTMWDFYQGNASANNYFGGKVRIGSATNFGTRNDALQVLGTASFGNNTTGADYSQFEADGTLVMKGNATVWGDIDFPMIVRSTGTNIPVHTTVLGNLTMPLWAVNDFVQADVQEIPHDWKEASALQWHIHIITNTLDATARYVAFEIEYTWANRGSAFVTPITVSSGDLLIPANTPAKTHLIFNVGAAWTPSGGTIAAHVKGRLKRIASTGTAPASNPFCEMMQIHYEKDTIGSRQITTK